MATVSYDIVNINPEKTTITSDADVVDGQGNESAPAVVGLANGGFVISYQFVPGVLSPLFFTNNAILADHYGTDFQWIQPQLGFGLPTMINTQDNTTQFLDPSVAQLSNGNAITTWTQSAGGIYYMMSYTAHVPEGIGQHEAVDGEIAASGLLAGTNATDSFSDVAALPNGGFAIVKQSNLNASDYDADLMIYNARAELVARRDLGANSTLKEQAPTLAVLNNGNIVTTYEKEKSDHSGYDVSLEIYTATGGTVVTPKTFDSVGTQNRSPDVVALKDGGFAIAYQDDGYGQPGLSLAFFTAAGTLRSIQRVDQAPYNDSEPSLAVLSNGFVEVTWTVTASESDITAAVYDPASMTRVFAYPALFGGIETQSNNQYQPSVAALKNGQFVTAWTDDNNSLTDGNPDDDYGSHVSFQVDALVRTTVGDATSERFAGDSLADHFTGGGGNDVFAYSHGGGADVITDFALGFDKIDLTNFGFTFANVLQHATQAGANLVIDGGNGDSLTLMNVSRASLHVSDIIGLKAVRDFNADSHSDLLWHNDNGTTSIWDSGIIGNAHVIAAKGAVDASWHIVGKGDFDGNSRSDILWQNDNGTVSIWNNGLIGAAHVIASAGAVASSWHIAGTGDFDGNLRDDILWRNDNGTVSIWDNGDISKAHVIASAGALPAGWNIAGTGDFDGNGKADILWRNDNGAVSIWDNGQIGGAHIVASAGAVPGGWHIVGTGDFDANGHDDILWQNDSGQVSIWDNGAIAGAHTIASAGALPAGWHVAGTGDFDGNGRFDIVWRNDDGRASIWDNGSMANAHIIAGLGAVPDGWHIV